MTVSGIGTLRMDHPDVVEAMRSLPDVTLSAIVRTLAGMGAHPDDESGAIGSALVGVRKGLTVGQSCQRAIASARAQRITDDAKRGGSVSRPDSLPDGWDAEAVPMVTATDALDILAETNGRAATVLRAVAVHAVTSKRPRTLSVETVATALGQARPRTTAKRVALQREACAAYGLWSVLVRPYGRMGERRDPGSVARASLSHLQRAKGIGGSAIWQEGVSAPSVPMRQCECVSPLAPCGMPERPWQASGAVDFIAPDAGIRAGGFSAPNIRRARTGWTYRTDSSLFGVGDGIMSGAAGVGAGFRDHLEMPTVRAESRKAETADFIGLAAEVNGQSVFGTDGEFAPIAGKGECALPTVRDGITRCGCAGRRGVLVDGKHALRHRAAPTFM